MNQILELSVPFLPSLPPTDCEWVPGHKERETESQAGSELSTEPDTKLDLTTLRSRPDPKPKIGHLTNCSTQTPLSVFLNTHNRAVKQFLSITLAYPTGFDMWHFNFYSEYFLICNVP